MSPSRPAARVLALALAFAALTASRSHAANSAFADTSKPVTFLKETVVTGARYPRAYYESPQALSFLSKAQLRDMAPAVIGDALQSLPGVDNSKDSPWEQRVVLRGLSGQRVLVLMDGMPMNSARGNGPHPSLVAAPLIERVEVVRGPSSVSYGSDAIGGAVNVITREASPAPDGRASGVRGNAQLGGGTAEAAFGGQVTVQPYVGRLGLLVSGGWRDANDFRTPSGKVPNSQYEERNAAVGARYDLTPHLTLRTGYQGYRGKDVGIPGLSFAFPGASQDFLFNYYDRDLAHLTLDNRYPDAWLENTRVRLYYQRERRNFFSTQELSAFQFGSFGVPPVPTAVGAITEQDRFFDLKTYGAQVQLTSKKHSGYRWTAGLDVASDRTSGNNVRRRTYLFTGPGGSVVPGPTAVRTTQSVPNGTFDNYGAYFQNEFYMTRELTLTTGARWNLYRYHAKAGPLAPGFSFADTSANNDAFSGSVGLVWQPVPDLHLSANVSSGYRQPNAQDLFFDGAASVGYVVGNPTLDPERALSYDVGARWSVGRAALSGNLFLSYYENLIDALPAPPVPQSFGQPTYRYANIATARTYGAEFEGETSFADDFVARATLATTVGEITSADAIALLYGVPGQDRAPLGGVPPAKGTFGVRWNHPGSRGFLEAGSRWSWRTNRLPLPTPGVGQLTAFKKEWIVADITAGLRVTDQLRATLGVRNVADRTYRQPLGSLDDPGRSFFMTLSSDF